MSDPDSDRSLRRLIDDLTGLNSRDISAILAGLEPAQRNTVDRLLKEHAGASLHPLMDRTDYDPVRLSPWLLERLRSDDTKEFAISTAARETLRACAARLYPLPPAKPAREAGRVFRRRGQ